MLSNAVSPFYSYRASRSLTKTGFHKTGVQIHELYRFSRWICTPVFRGGGGSVPLFCHQVDLYPCFVDPGEMAKQGYSLRNCTPVLVKSEIAFRHRKTYPKSSQKWWFSRSKIESKSMQILIRKR